MVFGTCAAKLLGKRDKRLKKCPKKLIFHVWGAGAPLGAPIAMKIMLEVPSEPRKPPSKFLQNRPAKFYYPRKKQRKWQNACKKEANFRVLMGYWGVFDFSRLGGWRPPGGPDRYENHMGGAQ